eukprot:1928920-Prymnesium_polylepis.1
MSPGYISAISRTPPPIVIHGIEHAVKILLVCRGQLGMQYPRNTLAELGLRDSAIAISVPELLELRG